MRGRRNEEMNLISDRDIIFQSEQSRINLKHNTEVKKNSVDKWMIKRYVDSLDEKFGDIIFQPDQSWNVTLNSEV